MLRIVPLLLMLVCLVSACKPTEEATAKEELKFKVVDIARIFRDSEPGKAGVEFLNSIQGEMQKELATMQAKLQANPEDAQVQQELQMTYNILQQRMNTEQQNVMNILNDLTQRAMDEYRNTHKLHMILGSETALSYDNSLDITADIIATINKQKVEFKPAAPVMPTPAPQPAEEKPADAKPADAKPADAKPADAKPADAKPADAKPADTKADDKKDDKK